MIEKTVLQFLMDKMRYPAFVEAPEALTEEYPENLPDEYLLLQKIAGSEENHIKKASIAIQSYADSKYRAAEMNEEVKTAMRNIAALSEIGGAHISSDYDFTDTQVKKYRYQAVFDITHY